MKIDISDSTVPINELIIRHDGKKISFSLEITSGCFRGDTTHYNRCDITIEDMWELEQLDTMFKKAKETFRGVIGSWQENIRI